MPLCQGHVALDAMPGMLIFDRYMLSRSMHMQTVEYVETLWHQPKSSLLIGCRMDGATRIRQNKRALLSRKTTGNAYPCVS
jgi:hypothetical protein